MKTQLQIRLESLQAEYEAGQKMLSEVEVKRQSLATTLLRIEGAMQLLQEMIKQEGSAASEDTQPARPPVAG